MGAPIRRDSAQNSNSAARTRPIQEGVRQPGANASRVNLHTRVPQIEHPQPHHAPSQSKMVYRCSYKDCTAKLTALDTELICLCRITFCSQHRPYEAHDCTALAKRVQMQKEILANLFGRHSPNKRVKLNDNGSVDSNESFIGR